MREAKCKGAQAGLPMARAANGASGGGAGGWVARGGPSSLPVAGSLGKMVCVVSYFSLRSTVARRGGGNSCAMGQKWSRTSITTLSY